MSKRLKWHKDKCRRDNKAKPSDVKTVQGTFSAEYFTAALCKALCDFICEQCCINKLIL